MSSRPPLLDGQTPLKNLKAFCQCTLTYSILLTNNLGWVVPNITYIQNSPHRFLFRNRNLRCTCETSPILPPFCLTLISPLTSKTSWKPKYELSILGNWTKKNCHMPTPSGQPALEELPHGTFSSRKLAIRKMFWETAPWKTNS